MVRPASFAARTCVLFSAIALNSVLGSSALAQVSMNAPTFVFGTGTFGMSALAGSNSAASGTVGANSFSGRFTGDVVTSLLGGNSPGATYNGATSQVAVVPFTVGALPVRIGEASVHANFKMVASGGNGIAGGNDPIVNVTLFTRLYQLTGASISPSTDPWLSAIEFSKTWTQNGNGLQIIDSTLGPATSNYILTPGTYYLYEVLNITTSYTSTGVVQPTRGMTVEFGGDLTSSTYSGINYTFDWQTVPAPGSVALLGFGVLAATRRKR